MASPSETKKAPALSNKVVIGAAAVVVAAVIAVGAVVVTHQSQANVPGNTTPIIGYAADAKVMLDQNSLQAAFDEAMRNAAEGNVGLKYQNDAYSSNGVDFQCRIINSDANVFDMFLTIYADAALTDQIFLSGLVPPGSGFEQITLDRALEPGNHTVNVVLTQVDTDENGAQVITNQVAHTMEFHVDQ